MFYLTARIGSMCAVYDDSDSTVEWCDKEVLKKYLSMGVAIEGVANNTVRPVTGLTCNWKNCNWTKSKRNIFDVADRVTINNESLVVYAEGKKYKAKILPSEINYAVAGSRYNCLFSNGIFVKVPASWVDSHK